MADNLAEARFEDNKACLYGRLAGTSRWAVTCRGGASVQEGQGIVPVEDSKEKDHRAEDSSGDSSSLTFKCKGVSLGDRS